MATYILQKPLPDSAIGDKYIYNETYRKYYKDGNVLGSYWDKEYVENNPEWFKPQIIGAIGVTLKGNVVDYENTAIITIGNNGKISAICMDGGIIFKPMKDHIFYTDSDLLNARKETWEAARMKKPLKDVQAFAELTYPNFEYYLKTIK